MGKSKRDEVITIAELEDQELEHPEIKKLSDQLHFVLTSLMPLKSEQWTIVKNSGKGNGLDAWRRLNKRYDPNNPQTNMALLSKVLHPPKTSLERLQQAIESWGENYRVHASRTGEALSNAMRRICLLTMCPDGLSKHLNLHAVRLDAYDVMKKEILTYLGVATSKGILRATPMEVDQMGNLNSLQGWGKGTGKKGDKGKGKKGDKGKGKGWARIRSLHTRSGTLERERAIRVSRDIVRFVGSGGIRHPSATPIPM